MSPSERVAGPEPRARLRALRGADRGHLLRVEHPPRPAGDRRGGRASAARSRSSAARCARTSTSGARWSTSGARRADHPAARDRAVGRREARDHLDRVTGRAAVGAAPDGLPRPPAGRAARAATPSSSRPRRSPATSARSTRRSTACTTSAATSSRPRDAAIHASGHGYAEELKLMLNLTRPRYVHADPRRLQADPAARAARRGRRHRRRSPSSAARTACRWRSTPRARASASRETSGMVFVDGVDIGDVDRRRAARPAHALGRRHLHHRRDRVRAGRLLGRPARGPRPRRSVPRRARARSSRSCARRSRTRSTARPSSG